MVRVAREGMLTVSDRFGPVVAALRSAPMPGATLLADLPAPRRGTTLYAWSATCSDGSAWRAGSRCCRPCAARAAHLSIHMVKADSEGSTLDRIDRPSTCCGPDFLMRTIELKEAAPGPARRSFIDRLTQA